MGAGGFYLSRVSNAPIAERPRLRHKTCNWLQLVGETDARPCIYTFPADGGVRGAGRDGGAFRLAGWHARCQADTEESGLLTPEGSGVRSPHAGRLATGAPLSASGSV